MKYKGREVYPWYKIAWNVIWLLPVVLTGAVFLLVILCAYGPKCAERVYHDVGV